MVGVRYHSLLLAWYGENGPSTLTLANTSLPQNIPLPALTPQELDVIAEMSKEDMRDLTRRYYQQGVNLSLLLARVQYFAQYENVDGEIEGVMKDVVTANPLSLIAGMTSAEIFIEAQSWYDPYISVATNPDGTQGRYDSIVGRLYLGLVQQMNLRHNDSAARQRMAAITEEITGISADQILAAIRRDGSVQSFMLQQLFTANGYGSIFVTNQPRGELCTMILSATTDKDEYTDAHDVIHISFDAIIASKDIATIKVYSGNTFLSGSRNRAFIDVPISALAMSGENVTLNVAITFTDGTGMEATTNAFGVEVAGTSHGDGIPLSDLNVVKDYIGHMGLDLTGAEGTPIIWNGPRAKVIEMTTISQVTDDKQYGDSYGTMLVAIEFELPHEEIFRTEAYDSSDSSLAKNVNTQRIRMFFGHIRPSSESIDEVDPNVRRQEGMNSNELSYAVGGYIETGQIIGFIESKQFGGDSSGPHVHVGAYTADNIPASMYRGAGVNENDPIRQQFIKPEDILGYIDNL